MTVTAPLETSNKREEGEITLSDKELPTSGEDDGENLESVVQHNISVSSVGEGLQSA